MQSHALIVQDLLPFLLRGGTVKVCVPFYIILLLTQCSDAHSRSSSGAVAAELKMRDEARTSCFVSPWLCNFVVIVTPKPILGRCSSSK